MFAQKALIASSNDDHNSIDEHVKYSDLHRLPDSSRAFEYNLNEKYAKSKL